MRWHLSLLVGLLASLAASTVLAQMPEGALEVRPLPPVEAPAAEATQPDFLSGDPMVADLPQELGPIVELSERAPLEGFKGYRWGSSSLDWIFGDDDQLGMFSLRSDHYRPAGVSHGLGVGMQFHFLNGPVTTDLPARLYDFSIGYQHRQRLGAFGYDVAAAVTASSDFEGSSREGIRFPAHAVGFLAVNPKLDLAFGVDYLDRGDIKLLPVMGLVAVPRDDVRLEIVFPRPRVVFQLSDKQQLYVGGELGGGTWAIERTTMVDDLATYRDLRLCVGLQRFDKDGAGSAIEIAYLFEREVEFTSGNGDYSPGDTAMIRLVTVF